MRAGFLTAVLLCGAVTIAAPAQASVEISSKPTGNMTCAAGVCMPTAKKAVLNATDLANMLATDDVKVATGNGAVTITVTAPFSWTSTHRLTLDANLNVSFKAPVIVAGQGAVTIVTNDGGTGGDLIFFDGGKLDFWDTSSSLVINGANYVLANTLHDLKLAIRLNRDVALIDTYDAQKDGVLSQAPITHLDGTLEGLGHTIANLSISTSHKHKPAALVRENDGLIRNIGLTNVDILGSVSAGLVGENGGLIQNAYVTGSVHGEYSAGGLALTNEPYVGGRGSGKIIRSRSDVIVSGGIIAGGLVAGNWSLIDSSYATGNVSGGGFAGGLVGAQYEPDGTAIIQNCYATGAVAGERAGGLIGLVRSNYGKGKIGFSFSRGIVSGHSSAGGAIGYDDVESNVGVHWDLDTSGISDPARGAGNVGNDPGVTGLTDLQMKSDVPAGYDRSIWDQDPNLNNGYPYLIANPPPK